MNLDIYKLCVTHDVLLLSRWEENAAAAAASNAIKKE